MKTTMKITLRAFPVKIQDTRTGEIKEDRIVLTKEQLHLSLIHILGTTGKHTCSAHAFLFF